MVMIWILWLIGKEACVLAPKCSRIFRYADFNELRLEEFFMSLHLNDGGYCNKEVGLLEHYRY